MRAFEVIREEIRQAKEQRDVRSLHALATEMHSLSTPHAVAVACNTLGFVEHHTGGYASALEYYRRALMTYEELNDRAGAASAAVNMGIVHLSTGNYSLALESSRRALADEMELCNRVGMARATVVMAHVYQATGEYQLAMECYGRALAIYEECDNQDGLAAVTTSMGILYARTSDYPKALEYFRSAAGQYEELGNRVEVARTSHNIGLLFDKIGDYQQALQHLYVALSTNEELDDRAGVALAAVGIGNVHKSIGDYPLALAHYRRALSVHDELGDLVNVALITSNIVSVFMALERYDEATEALDRQAAMLMEDPGVRSKYKADCALLATHKDDLNTAHRYLTEALAITIEVGLRAESAEYHRLLRDLAQKRNDFSAYIDHNNEYQRITEEVNGKATAQRLAIMDAEKRIAAERAETEKHRTLLYNTLPPAIADRVLRGEQVNDAIDNATVMFMDMVGFTTMSSTMDPSDVVRMLNVVFTACDAIASEHGLMKIKTIGDCYMAVAFPEIKEQGMNSIAESRVACAALAMVRMMAERYPYIAVRIGVHSGPVTAGVIGTERLQYDVWGDTVNVASRMESSGEPGRIHVSESFALALDPGLRRGDDTVGHPGESGEPDRTNNNDSVTNDSMTLLKRGTIDVKGKGPMTTYWLEGA